MNLFLFRITYSNIICVVILVSHCRSASLDQLTPWFARYRHEYFNAFHPAEHETFQHPVALVFIVHPSTPNALDHLFQMQSLPLPSYYDHAYPYLEVLRYYLIVQDAQTDSDAEYGTQLFQFYHMTNKRFFAFLPFLFSMF
jgi:hypothetical protein